MIKLQEFFCLVIKNPLTRAYILAVGRHAVTLLGGILVAHGYLHGDDVSDFLGFLTTVVGIYLAQIDVRGVDQKIKIAEQKPIQPIPEKQDQLQSESNQLQLPLGTS